jgi:uncharacterized protein (TIGR03083 family)
MLAELEPTLASLKDTRETLMRLLDQLAEIQASQVMVNPQWSVKDIVGHLVGAERGMTRMAQQFATGSKPMLPAEYDNDVYNARQVEKRKSLTYAQARAELEASRADLLALIDKLTAPQLDYLGEHPIKGIISLKELLGVIAWHEGVHSKEISVKLLEARK